MHIDIDGSGLINIFGEINSRVSAHGKERTKAINAM